MADAGGTSKGLGGAEWIEVVTKGVEDMTVASVVSELAVEPMPCDEDTVPRYINGVLARLQEAWVGEQVADLKSKLQRVSPAAAPEEYNSLFGDLVALEQYRRQLREQAVATKASDLTVFFLQLVVGDQNRSLLVDRLHRLELG